MVYSYMWNSTLSLFAQAGSNEEIGAESASQEAVEDKRINDNSY